MTNINSLGYLVYYRASSEILAYDFSSKKKKLLINWIGDLNKPNLKTKKFD